MLASLRQLVNRCLTRDQDAMVELVDRYRNQVFGLCLRILGQRQDAEDAAQETMVRMLKSLSRWDPTRDFEPWLLTIAGNRCRTMLAARRRRPPATPLGETTCPDRSADLDAARNLAEEVQLALTRIRPEYRQAFLLFHEHELSYEQISETLDRPLGTIKSWIRRARRELVNQLRHRDVVQEPRHELRSL